MTLSDIADRLRSIAESLRGHAAICPQCDEEAVCPECESEVECSHGDGVEDDMDALILEIEIAERRQREKASA
jgi:hypothetical protein